MGEGSYLLLVLVNLFLILLHLLCLWQHFLPELLTFLTLLVKLSQKLFKLWVKESFCSWQSVFVSVLMFSCFVKIFFCAIKFLSCAVKLCYDRFKLVLAVSFNFCHLAKCFLSVFTKCLGLENPTNDVIIQIFIGVCIYLPKIWLHNFASIQTRDYKTWTMDWTRLWTLSLTAKHNFRSRAAWIKCSATNVSSS